MLIRPRKLPPSTSLAAEQRLDILRWLGRRDLPAENHRLRRIRAVDQHDPGRAGRAGGAVNCLTPGRDRRGRPLAELGLDQRLDLGQRTVRDDEDLHPVGTQPGVLEANQLVAGKARGRRGIASGQRRIGMVVTVQQCRERRAAPFRSGPS